ncbi:MAG TPA: L-threonylcarbamoyladenylate synthase [Candidatus Levybacteria bacterium]|nr:L-threonylcarbamoyladenylate synthase [Candidatus Levybacteria bacterium]
MKNDIQQTIDTLVGGGIVIFPTDTAFGIGCRIDDEKAVQRLFKIRKRAETKPAPVLVSSTAMAEKWVDIPSQKVRSLMKNYWPGGLTIILNSKNTRVSKLVKGGGNTLGVRMPDHADLLQIIEKIGVPIIGSSANFAGESTPYLYNDLSQELIQLVDFVLPGNTRGGTKASTVIDCTKEPFTILREGAVKL